MDLNLTTEKVYDFFFETSKNEDLVAFPNLPFCGSFASILFIDLTYIAFVVKIGPWFMRNREPYNVKKLIMAHNLIQVIICSGLFTFGIYYLFFSSEKFNIACVLKLPANHPKKYIEISLGLIGYISKYLDYADTVFFVLRKSFRQISFLHVYHHVIMTFATYVYIRDYGFGGHSMASGIVNTFIHIIMYSYYFITAANPELKKSIWWKRHITELQLVQFVICFIHHLLPFVSNCPFPKHWLYVSMWNLILFIILFTNFYKKAYLNNNEKDVQDNISKAKLVKKAL